jgi:ATP-dependent Clp protease ATP-binding subunit ClpB
MLAEKEGVARAILRKLGVSPEAIAQETMRALDRLPKITGATDVYFSPAPGRFGKGLHRSRQNEG